MKVLLIILLLVYAIGATRPPRIDVEDHPVQEHDSIGKFVELKEHQTIIFKCSGPHDDLEFKFPDMSDHKGYNEVTYLNRVEEVNDDDLGDRVLTITNVQQSDTGAYSCISLEQSSLNDTIYVFVHGENTFIPSIIAMLSYGDEDVMVPCRTTMFVDKNDIELYADGQLIKNAMKNYDHRFGYKIDKNIYDEKLSDTRFECKYKKEPNQRVFS
uniref:IG domain-containing protein n=1 Tax=Caenorhabditis tropicalis TaxID=1561998 RepID=A0A1I7U1A4_9PELO